MNKQTELRWLRRATAVAAVARKKYLYLKGMTLRKFLL